jgi:hypothetical protein
MGRDNAQNFSRPTKKFIVFREKSSWRQALDSRTESRVVGVIFPAQSGVFHDEVFPERSKSV